MEKGRLSVPKPKRSIEIVNTLRENYLNLTSPVQNNSIPNATSTQDKRRYQSMSKSHLIADNYAQKRNVAITECDESSLGLLDIDKEFERTNPLLSLQSDFKSLSFHSKEMSGRSTNVSNSGKSKENRPPDEDINLPSTSNNNKKSLMSIDDILRDANQQSAAVDEILKSSDNPDVANIRMSLDSYKQSISGTKSGKTEAWNFRPDDFENCNISENDPNLRDSMFGPASKIDMSKEELSWMKEHGDLPVHITSATFASCSEKNTSGRLPNVSNDFSNLRSNVSNVSKVSFGNYFKRRSENINHILSAPSPEKVGPFPPLYDPDDELHTSGALTSKVGETYNKGRAAKSLPFHTLSDDSDLEVDHATENDNVVKLSNVDNLYVPKHSNALRNITGLVIDETSYGSPISCSQIRDLVDNFDTEKRSILLDNLLAQTKYKSMKNRNQLDVPKANESIKPHYKLPKQHFNGEQNKEDTINKLSSSRLLDKSSFGQMTNVFHSTKHAEELDNLLGITTNASSVDYKNSSKNALESHFHSDIAKGTRSLSPSLDSFGNENNSSGFVSTLKSHGKSNSGSSGITENSSKSTNTVVQNKLSNVLNKITEDDFISNTLNSHNRDNNSSSIDRKNQNDGTISDTSKEIINIMSPSSNNSTLHHSKKNESKLWEMPFKNQNSTTCDWVSVESKQEYIVAGCCHDINITLASLCQRWISVKICVDSLHVDDQLYTNEDIISQFIFLQPSAASILLNIDSQVVCKVRAVAMVANQLMKLIMGFKLTDMVTKAESYVQHEIVVLTLLPKLVVKCEDMKSDSIRFPSLPEEADACIPFFIFNNSDGDVPIEINISSPYKDVFAISTVTIIPREDADRYYLSNVDQPRSKKSVRFNKWALQSKNLSKMQRLLVPDDKLNCLKILLHYKCPHLANLERLNSVQHVDAIMSINIVPEYNPDVLIPFKQLSVVGGVGLWKCVMKTKQTPLMINQGCTEDIILTNGGTLNLHYKIYISDDDKNQKNLLVSKSPIFVVDENEVFLKPGEEMKLNVTYPSEYTCGDIQKKLILSCPHKIEIIDLVGIAPRSISQQSACSLDSATSQSQNISIKSSKRELSWGSVKAGTSQMKDIALKNTSDKKIRIMVSISEDCFKLLGDNDTVSSLMFTLLPQECKSLRIEFRPNKSGGFVGSLKILHRTKVALNLLSKVMLHGVGDVSVLVFKDGIFKHSGSQGLPLGSLNESGDTKDIHFSVWNKGTADAFVMYNLELKWKYRTLEKEIKVIPPRGIVAAGRIMHCVVRVPRKVVYLAKGRSGEVENLATLTILHGDDFTRQRIKRICSQNVINESFKEIWNKESQGKLDSICMHFPEEDYHAKNLNNFRETPGVLKLLLDELQQKEITLTYDIDLDNTMARMSSEFDDTVQFHTMYADTTQDTVASDI